MVNYIACISPRAKCHREIYHIQRELRTIDRSIVPRNLTTLTTLADRPTPTGTEVATSILASRIYKWIRDTSEKNVQNPRLSTLIKIDWLYSPSTRLKRYKAVIDRGYLNMLRQVRASVGTDIGAAGLYIIIIIIIGRQLFRTGL